jgi:hypothetical protein
LCQFTFAKTLIREKLCNALSKEKGLHKILMILTLEVDVFVIFFPDLPWHSGRFHQPVQEASPLFTRGHRRLQMPLPIRTSAPYVSPWAQSYKTFRRLFRRLAQSKSQS